MAEGFVILDDVFVPNERIFLDGAVQQAAVFAHSLGLWERLGGPSAMDQDSESPVGLPQLAPAGNGTPTERHRTEKSSPRPPPSRPVPPALDASIPDRTIT